VLTRTATDVIFRSAGAPLVSGNQVRILCDAAENYPAWTAAIERARRTIHLEMYIVHDDGVGREARDLLTARARAGVTVRVLYDWFGSLRLSSRRFWRPLVAAGGEVRAANRLRADSLFGLLSRDHRKLLAVDGEVAFVSGLCIGDEWMGDPARGIPPWRDTGLELRGPAVADAEAAFAAAWGLWGAPLPDGEVPPRARLPEAGSVAVRVIATAPEQAAIYRTDLAVATLARERFWVTDAYFIATPPYIEALRAAARDGVDVRLLLPERSDIRWIADYSRSLYRPLLEAGVRVFEWSGSMVHAKTAVADGRWARIGSSNLNLASWIGNWELDVAIEDDTVAKEVEAIFVRDLVNATEIVITERNRVRPTHPHRPAAPRTGGPSGSANRMLADVTAMRQVLGAAVKGYRVLGRTEASSIALLALAVLVLAAVLAWLPRLLVYPVVVLLVWEGVALLVKAWRLRRGGDAPPGATAAPRGEGAGDGG
jgi:phosphatidylserine/phosphatidylglycerophosphate/cardiolipin synthase-like enzyme